MDLENKKKTVRKHMFMSVALAALAPAGLLTAMSVVAPAAAQDYTSGAFAGSVIDGAGNPVSGATVTIRSQDAGFSRSTTTSSSGGFRFAGLPAGAYDVTVAASGGSASEQITVGASSTTNYSFVVGGSSDNVVVTGTRQNFDFSNTTTGVNIDVENLVKEIPVGRNLTALTLLAPGTSQGDSAFGNLSSLGGSSVAENAYYLNGLNITDFNNYLGSSLVPFEFYKSVEVKTGGYPAEFGRATGGVVNAVTKSGSNDFMAALHFNWEPDELRSDRPDTYIARNQRDVTRNLSVVAEVGGPIIQDRLFAYGIVEMRDNLDADSGYLSAARTVDTQKSPFWGAKIDAYPIDDHHLEFTYFDSDRKTTRTIYDYDPTLDTVGTDPVGVEEYHFGGASWVAKYTGVLADWLTVSAAYGKNNDRNEFMPLFGTSALPFTRDLTPTGEVFGGFAVLGNPQATTLIDFPQYTQRKFFRADADIFFNLMGDHHVRIGFDQEKNNLVHDSTRTGGGMFPRYYQYRECGASPRCTGPVALGPTDNYVEINHYLTGGVFDGENTAYYFQDEWNVTDRLTLNLGVRLDQFKNFTADGTQFIGFNGLFAPRAGFSFDVFGNGAGRLYGSFGSYYLPIAGNTGFRQGSAELYFREYWTYSSVDSDGIPVLDTQLVDWPGANACPYGLEPGSAGSGSVSCNVTGDGSVQFAAASSSRNLRATREREIIVGYEHQIDDLWKVGINYTRRNLRVTAEDIAIDAAVNAYCDDPANGVDQTTTACSDIWTGYHQYTLVNPGVDSTIILRDVLPGETERRTVNFTAAELGYPPAKRSYDAVEFNFERAFDGRWSLRGSYTWSKSKGNSEGFVQSDFGQDDAGITQDYDQPGFTDYSYGYLPNHRTHRFKMWGSYAVTEALTLGTQVRVDSPRRLSCFGYYPTDGDPANGYNNFENGYGAASHYCGGLPAPRGEGNKTDWMYNVDTSVRYNIEIPSGQQLTLRADVFNIFNSDGVTERNEIGENSPGGLDNPRYGEPTQYQTPRYVRLGVDIGF